MTEVVQIANVNDSWFAPGILYNKEESHYLESKWNDWLDRHLRYTSFKNKEELRRYLLVSNKAPVGEQQTEFVRILVGIKDNRLTQNYYKNPYKTPKIKVMLANGFKVTMEKNSTFMFQISEDSSVQKMLLHDHKITDAEAAIEQHSINLLKIYVPRLKVFKVLVENKYSGYIFSLSKRPYRPKESFILKRRRKIFRKLCMPHVKRWLWAHPEGLMVQKALRETFTDSYVTAYTAAHRKSSLSVRNNEVYNEDKFLRNEDLKADAVRKVYEYINQKHMGTKHQST